MDMDVAKMAFTACAKWLAVEFQARIRGLGKMAEDLVGILDNTKLE